MRSAVRALALAAGLLALLPSAEAQQTAAVATANTPLPLAAPSTLAPGITISLPSLDRPAEVVPALKILILLSVLSLAPAIIMSMTAFTRIVIVLSFLRQALGTQHIPPTQVMASLAIFLTAIVMAPTAKRIYEDALEPYSTEEIPGEEAYERSSAIARDFLLKQTREEDLLLYYDISKTPRPSTREETSMLLLIPAFMTSELRTGFEMGFLIFLPFILIDIVVASLLTSMGMIMLPPTMMAIPLKILLFVVVDGWALLTQSLVASFQ